MVKNLNAAKRLPVTFDVKGVGRVIHNPWRERVNKKNVASVSAYADHLKEHLVRKILKHGRDRTVLICVAWFSDPKIIAALAHCKRVLAIVNNEEFGKWGGGGIAQRFNALPAFKEPLWQAFKHLDTPLNMLERKRSTCGYRPVRCYGGGGSSNGRGFSSGSYMHAKYLVFCDEDGIPCSYWLGSANFTGNSSNNQEAAQFVKDATLAKFWFDDFANTFLFSKELCYGRSYPGVSKPSATARRGTPKTTAGTVRVKGTVKTAAKKPAPRGKKRVTAKPKAPPKRKASVRKQKKS